MNKLQKGTAEAITGIVLGTILTTTVVALAKDGTLPSYFILLFGLFSIIANIVTINSFRYTGMLYTIGWLLGALLLKDSLSTVDMVFNIGGPILVLILRVCFWIRSIRS